MKQKKYERVVAVGCSHGDLANAKAIEAVLKFVDRWKPKHRIHLGDAYDFTAFRTGARPNSGDPDEARPIGPDIIKGQHFLDRFAPTVFCMGNHEHRLVKLCGHYNEVISTAANSVLKDCLAPIKKHNAKLIPYTIHDDGWYKLGGYRWGHGHLYGENFLRDSAESFGSCVVAHAHRAGVSKGRCLGNPTAYCVGTLADIPQMGYASGRRSTLSWSHGFVFGEVCGDEAHLSLWEWPQGTTNFRLPI
jgi:hypothetical protein